MKRLVGFRYGAFLTNLLRVSVVAQLLFALVLPAGMASADPSITEYPIPNSSTTSFNTNPIGITTGPDGNIWFTEAHANAITRLNNDGTFTDYPLPTIVAEPYSITTGPDGALWFTELYNNSIGRITTSGVITEYQLPGSGVPNNFVGLPDGTQRPLGNVPFSITTGPDGALWFTFAYGIGRITTSGDITTYAMPAQILMETITTGPDGALWFTETQSKEIGRITTAGVISEFPTPSNYGGAQGIVAGPDGNMWLTFAGDGPAGIGVMAPSGSMVTTYPLSSSALPYNIMTGPDNAMWFTDYGTNTLDRITTSGQLSQYLAPTPNAMPYFLTTDPDGNIWFTEGNRFMSQNNLGELRLNTSPTNLTLAPSNNTGTTGGTASFTATATTANSQPAAGVTVRYSVSGSVTASGSCVTDSTGSCTFSYTGPQLAGADLVDAYADTNNNSQQDQSEPATNATMAWDLPANSTTSGSVHGHGKFTASNGHKFNVGFHAINQNGTVSGTCNIVDQTTNTVYDCTDATVLVENTATGQATIFGGITINGQATTYRIDTADNSGTNQPDTFSFVAQNGYSVGGTLDKNAKVTVQ